MLRDYRLSFFFLPELSFRYFERVSTVPAPTARDPSFRDFLRSSTTSISSAYNQPFWHLTTHSSHFLSHTNLLPSTSAFSTPSSRHWHSFLCIQPTFLRTNLPIYFEHFSLRIPNLCFSFVFYGTLFNLNYLHFLS